MLELIRHAQARKFAATKPSLLEEKGDENPAGSLSDIPAV